MTSLGELITKLREDKGWSAKELARRCTAIRGGDKPVSGTHINRLEQNKVENPGTEFIRIVAKALNVDPLILYAAYLGRDLLCTNKDVTVYRNYAAHSQAVEALFKALPDDEIARILKDRETETLKELGS